MNVKKLKELLNKIPEDYHVAFEIVRNPEDDINCKNDIISYEDFDRKWEFLKSHCIGCYSLFAKEKILGLQIHY